MEVSEMAWEVFTNQGTTKRRDMSVCSRGLLFPRRSRLVKEGARFDVLLDGTRIGIRSGGSRRVGRFGSQFVIHAARILDRLGYAKTTRYRYVGEQDGIHVFEPEDTDGGDHWWEERS